jgi:hypothetical protein
MVYVETLWDAQSSTAPRCHKRNRYYHPTPSLSPYSNFSQLVLITTVLDNFGYIHRQFAVPIGLYAPLQPSFISLEKVFPLTQLSLNIGKASICTQREKRPRESYFRWQQNSACHKYLPSLQCTHFKEEGNKIYNL